MKSYKEILGNKTWDFLHTLADGLPNKLSKKESKEFKKFFLYLSKIYPCEECQIFFAKYIDKFDIDSSNRILISKYLIDFHNIVNIKLNKPIYLPKNK
tara:strand:- start:176 stop:469 length:294 start_codon:yes stop_codon:yes gene_type:complete